MSTPLEASQKPAPAGVVLIVLAPFALGYFLSYLFRSVNAVVGPNLAADIGLSASELGLLTSAYPAFLTAGSRLQLGQGVDPSSVARPSWPSTHTVCSTRYGKSRESAASGSF